MCIYTQLYIHIPWPSAAAWAQCPPAETSPSLSSGDRRPEGATRGTIVRATRVRAYDDRALGSFVRTSYVSTLCPVVICPYLCTSDIGIVRTRSNSAIRYSAL